MKRVLFCLALCASLVPSMAVAQDASPNPNLFTDPAMSFLPPPDFVRLPAPEHSPAQFDQPTVVAAWIRNQGQANQQMITITMETYSGNASDFEHTTEQELRNAMDGVFITKHDPVKLSNGMPAFWQEITIGSGFNEVKRFQYVWGDTVRGVQLAITAGFGEVDETQAKDALANASAVLFPRNRYQY